MLFKWLQFVTRAFQIVGRAPSIGPPCLQVAWRARTPGQQRGSDRLHQPAAPEGACEGSAGGVLSCCHWCNLHSARLPSDERHPRIDPATHACSTKRSKHKQDTLIKDEQRKISWNVMGAAVLWWQWCNALQMSGLCCKCVQMIMMVMNNSAQGTQTYVHSGLQ